MIADKIIIPIMACLLKCCKKEGVAIFNLAKIKILS